MNQVLDNPVYNALLTGDATRSQGTETVKYFDAEISPFIGFDRSNNKGFEELYDLLPEGRKILYASRQKIEIPEGWTVTHQIEGTQFLFTGKLSATVPDTNLIPLEKKHV